MTAFGTSPLGTDLGPFGGPGLITILGVLPLGENSVSLVWDRVPTSYSPALTYSATNPANYSITAVDPSTPTVDGVYVPPGKLIPKRDPLPASLAVDPDDRSQVILSVDTPFEKTVEYVLEILPKIVGIAGETFAGPTSFQFSAVKPAVVLQTKSRKAEQYRDFAYYTFPRPDGGPSLVYEFDPNTDIGIQDGQSSLKKRIFRRLLSDRGGFSFLPGYGVGLKVKSLARGGRLQELASEVEAQVKQEPDVLDAGASCALRVTTGGTFVVVQVRAKTRDGDEALSLEVSVV